MKLTISTKGLSKGTAGARISPTMKAFVARKLRIHLGKFEHHVMEVRVTLEDTNGPKGGADKRCAVQVDVRGAEHFAVEEKDSRFSLAIARASERAGKVLARIADRRQRRHTPHGTPKSVKGGTAANP